MNFGKKRFLRRSTEKGQVEWALGCFYMVFLAAFLCACIQLEAFRASSDYLEDALAASNLASAVPDIKEYGRSGRIWIKNPEEAFDRYKVAIVGNLNLNAAWECPNRRLIAGPVRVVTYIVYNVSGDEVYINSFDAAGQQTQSQGQLGSVRSPDGRLIECTGVYSEITFLTEGLFGVKVDAHKGKLADVVAEER